MKYNNFLKLTYAMCVFVFKLDEAFEKQNVISQWLKMNGSKGYRFILFIL